MISGSNQKARTPCPHKGYCVMHFVIVDEDKWMCDTQSWQFNCWGSSHFSDELQSSASKVKKNE